MGRKKVAQNVKISAFLSAHNDSKEGRFIQVGNSLLLSPVFHALNASTRYLYLCLLMEAGGKPEVTFTRSNAHKYGISPATFDRCKNELCTNGFIMRVGNEECYQYQECKFQFITEWKTKEIK